MASSTYSLPHTLGSHKDSTGRLSCTFMLELARSTRVASNWDQLARFSFLSLKASATLLFYKSFGNTA